MLKVLKQKVYTSKIWHKKYKCRTELDHWRETAQRIVRWYQREEQYVFPFPDLDQMETRYDLQTNALLTYIKIETEHASYLKDLYLRADSFRGMRVADIGSGPFPTLLVFKDCERYCIDHLLDDYKELGFPVLQFGDRINFVAAKSEYIPFTHNYFDAIISRNALDHVDDFAATAKELKRLLKPRGFLHLCVNYHQPTSSEPIVLSDEVILENFSGLRLRKIDEKLNAWGFEGGKTVVWSNLPETRLDFASMPAIVEEQELAMA
jgi:SAM-dependent methyltransferase